MIEKTYVLTLREAPDSVNRPKANRKLQWLDKKQWEQKFLQEMMVAGMTKGMEFCSVDITIRFRRRPSKVDEENYRHPVIKPLADALVQGGYLKDDTNEWFAVGSFGFEFPTEWPYADPRIKHELIIRLEASYL